jgi:hypothetical protein
MRQKPIRATAALGFLAKSGVGSHSTVEIPGRLNSRFAAI